MFLDFTDVAIRRNLCNVLANFYDESSLFVIRMLILPPSHEENITENFGKKFQKIWQRNMKFDKKNMKFWLKNIKFWQKKNMNFWQKKKMKFWKKNMKFGTKKMKF